jgi:hypothetical protein
MERAGKERPKTAAKMDDFARHQTVEMWPICRLRLYERNSRRHTAEQIGQIAASIREWGWTMPILAVDDGMVLAGHGRLAAGRLLGIAEVPVIVARGWSETRSAPNSSPMRAIGTTKSSGSN